MSGTGREDGSIVVHARLNDGNRRRPGLVAAEQQGLLLAQALGLTTVDSELSRVGEVDCLIVERFDRRVDGDDVVRVHQEDLCQAMGVDHVGPGGKGKGKGKYQFGGGPSFRDLAGLLDNYSANPAAELDQLVAVMVFTVVIGNADAHGKNLALLHPSPEHISLAPLYDTVPTVLWPRLRTRMSMTIGGVWDPADVTLDAVAAEARSWPHPEIRSRQVAERTAAELIEAVRAEVVASDSPLGKHVLRRAEQLLAAS